MPNRFQDLITSSPLPGANRFSDLVQPQTNRFSDLINTQPQQDGFIKKTIKSFGGAIGAVGRALTVGQQATTGLIEKGLETTGILKDTGIQGTGISEGVKEQKSNVELLQRVGRETTQPDTLGGYITGNYTPSTSVFGNFVKELPSTTLGVLADVFVDPLFFASKLGAVAKGTSAIGKGIATGAKSLAEEIPAVQKVGDMLGKAFITRYGQSEAFKSLDIARKVEESLVPEKVGKLVSDVIEKPAAIQQRITQVIKGGITADNEVKILAEPIRQELDRIGESISKLNPKLLSEETFQANKGTYFPRLYTNYEFPKTEEVVNQVFGGRATSIPGAPFKARIADEEFAQGYLKSLPIDEVRAKYPKAVQTRTDAQLAAFQKNYPDIQKEYITTNKLDLNTVKRIAEESRKSLGQIKEAGYPTAVRLTQLNITETRQKFFKDISQLASNEPKPGWIQLSEDKALGNLAGKFLPAAEYKAIAEIRKIPGQVEQMYNKALTIWKTFKTAYNPSTISRNDLTNFFILNPLGGVGPHRLDIYAKTANELISKGPLYQMAKKEGLEISTQQAAELMGQASKFYRENQGLVKQFFGKVGDFHNAVKNFYGSQDKFFKLANFIKGVTEDGLTPQKALQRANFYLVDYSEVPEVINWLRKSPVGIPFISFTYGVSKPLAKTLLTRPDKLGAYFKILSGIQQMNPMGETSQERQAELDVLPDWIQQGTTLRLPVKDKYGRGQYIDLQYILPFNILESHSITPSSPVLNTLAAILTNKDTFSGKDITMNTDTAEEKTAKWSTYLVRQLIPSLAPFGYSWEKVKALIQNRPDTNGYVRKTLPVLIDVLGGIKITPIDQTIEGQKRAYEKRKELEELRTNLIRIQTDKTLLPETKSEESVKIQQKIDKLFMR